PRYSSGSRGSMAIASMLSRARRRRPAFLFSPAATPARSCSIGPASGNPEKAARPVNLADARALSPLLSRLSAALADLPVEIESATGQMLSIDDAELLRELGALSGGAHSLSLLRSERGMTDCRPISLLSLQTVTETVWRVGTLMYAMIETAKLDGIDPHLSR